MDIIILRPVTGKRSRISIGSRALYASLFAMLVLGISVAYGAYRLGVNSQWTAQQELRAQVKALTEDWQAVLKRQQSDLARVTSRAKDGLRTLARQVGRLQAKVARLTALGRRLVARAGLENGEFDFTKPSPRGGPEASLAGKTVSLNNFLVAMAQLERAITDRQQQLGLLETVLVERERRQAAFPAGRPLRGGWISSGYGYRTDPFSGRREFHGGIDFAARAGTKILAVAAGIVTWAGENGGYGKMVEIDHGNGYVSRYGHSRKILVQVGERVTDGQPIALMGSTGRSTGPHVHFEILYEGHTVDPRRFVKAGKNAREG